MYFKIGKLKNPQYAAWIRKQSCFNCGKNPPSQHHHILHGTAKRNIDLASLPCCDYCHRNIAEINLRYSDRDLIELSYKYISEYMK